MSNFYEIPGESTNLLIGEFRRMIARLRNIWGEFRSKNYKSLASQDFRLSVALQEGFIFVEDYFWVTGIMKADGLHRMVGL